MTEKKERNPIVDYLIGSIAFGLLAWIVSIFSDDAREFMRWAIDGLVTWLWWFVWYPITMPLWVWLPLIVLAAGAIDYLIRPEEKTPELTVLDYHNDVFDGIRWSWKYVPRGDSLVISTITPFCLQDSMEMIHGGHDEWSRHTPMKCESCGRTHDFEGNWDHVKGKIERMIRQKINTGAWKEVVERQLRERIA